MSGYTFATRCVDVAQEDVGKLHDLYDHDREVKHATFRRKLGADAYREFEQSMGYTRHGLRLAKDYHVAYYVSKWEGREALHVDHSAVDYVWTRAE